MSKHLPKATSSTLIDIQREAAGVGAGDKAAPPATPEMPVAGTTAPVAKAPVGRALRRTEATSLVERYTTYSALGACLPLALIESLSVGVVIYNMVQALADHYRLSFRQDQLKAAISALAGGLLSPVAGGFAAQLAGRVIPGAWLFTTAASSASAAICTRQIGMAFIDYFEAGDPASHLDIGRLRAHYARAAGKTGAAAAR